ncbi:hypothetical protein ACJX0J_011038 [Zea mays]
MATFQSILQRRISSSSIVISCCFRKDDDMGNDCGHALFAFQSLLGKKNSIGAQQKEEEEEEDVKEASFFGKFFRWFCFKEQVNPVLPRTCQILLFNHHAQFRLYFFFVILLVLVHDRTAAFCLTDMWRASML